MQQTIQSLSALCMLAALCTLLMQDSQYRASVRLVLGLEISRILLGLMVSTFKTLG